ncbi:MAG: hypothetical protein EOP06_04095, partial [Proteobacteria bacterium]
RRDRAVLDQLVEPGVIGLYNSIEITEVLGVQGKTFTNILTLAVAEPREAPATVNWDAVLLTKERVRLPGTSWIVGISQYRLPVKTFLEKVAEFGASGQWKPSPNIAIQTGTLSAMPPQFVPSDSRESHPWNGILKNNFFEGSHVLELFDTTKQYVKPLLAESRKLTKLAQIVGKYLPIRVDGMSDRLGNVIIQLPVTVISTEVRGSAAGDHSVAVSWHPDVQPRTVHIAAEIWQDSTVTNFDSAEILTGEAKLHLNSPGGGARTHIWDKENSILLSATPPVSFFTSAFFSISTDIPEINTTNREFFLPGSGEGLIEKSLKLIERATPQQVIGSTHDVPREPWVSQRVFSESVLLLKARKEFVQYGIDELEVQETTKLETTSNSNAVDEDVETENTTPEAQSRKLMRRMVALEDLHWLMEQHGEEGVWLWDPFLNADDVLRTLFFCRYNNVALRALTAGKTSPGVEQKLEIQQEMSQREIRRLAREREDKQKRDQADRLEGAKGNCLGLHLEFRIRVGNAGWGFHDRFIIFPRAQGSALAWSLGTSINSFGDEHHILQKVSHGEPIAQAFNDLWEQLKGPRYVIWKTPASEKQEQ